MGDGGPFCLTGEPTGTDLPAVFHFTPVSYEIGNFCKPISLAATCLQGGFLLRLFFDPEVVDDMFLRNMGWLSTNYAAL
jgi:hypothetical protein